MKTSTARNGVPVRVTTEAHSAIQRAALDYSAKVGRRISLSEIVLSLHDVAIAHPDEIESALRKHGAEE